MVELSSRAKRGWLAIFVLALAFGILASQSVVHPDKAEAIGIPFVDLPTPCDLLPDGTVTDICKGATNPVGAVGDVIGAIPGVPNPIDIFKDIAASAANSLFRQVAQAEADAVVWILKEEGELVTSSTSPDLTEAWFTRPYAIVFGFAVLLATMMFILKMTSAAKRGDPVMVGSIIGATVVFALGAAILPAVVGLAVYISDKEITPSLISATGTSLDSTLSGVEFDFSKEISSSNNPVVPILLPLIALALGVLGGLASLVLLSVRYALLPFGTIAVLLGLALNVGLNWGGDALKKATLWLTGWILFMPAIALSFLLGATMLNNANNILTSITAGVMLALAPYIAWKFAQSVAKHEIQLKPVDRSVSAIRNWKLLRGR